MEHTRTSGVLRAILSHPEAALLETHRTHPATHRAGTVLVTGGAGFIGSNIVHALNRVGETNILIVDNLSKTSWEIKRVNLEGAVYAGRLDKLEFRRALAAGDFDSLPLRAVLHQGACSDTLQTDERYMLGNNCTASAEILGLATRHGVPFVYASTAAVYGLGREFAPEPRNENPLNVYGRSKLRFDNLVREKFSAETFPHKSTVVGLRYFNVYGPREAHKGRMASMIHQFTRQLQTSGTIRMFQGTGGYADGEQRRDFVSVEDLVRINLFFAGLLPESPRTPVHAIVNVGTGTSRTFREVASALMDVHGAGRIEFIPVPADLRAQYQPFTQADIASLREAGYTAPLRTLEEGIRETVAKAVNP